MRLSKIVIIAIVTIMAATGYFGAAEDNKQPFTITISAYKDTVRIGEETRLHVVLANISDQSLVFRRSVSPITAEHHYTVLVHDKRGKNTQETEYGRHTRLHQLIGSDSAILLKPGEKLEEDAILSDVFDLTSPGEYEIQFLRPVSEDPNEKEIVKSNTITITVIE